MYHNFFIHSSVNGHLDCFHVLAIINSVAMNNGIHVTFSIFVSSGYMPRMGLLGHMVLLFLVFKGIAIPSSIVAVSIYIPTVVQECSLFCTPFPAFIICRPFDEGHSDRREVISHCSFDLHFLNNYSLEGNL